MCIRDRSDGTYGDQILHAHSRIIELFGYVDDQSEIMFNQYGLCFILIFRSQITDHPVLLICGKRRWQDLCASDVMNISFPLPQKRFSANHLELHFPGYCYL